MSPELFQLILYLYKGEINCIFKENCKAELRVREDQNTDSGSKHSLRLAHLFFFLRQVKVFKSRTGFALFSVFFGKDSRTNQPLGSLNCHCPNRPGVGDEEMLIIKFIFSESVLDKTRQYLSYESFIRSHVTLSPIFVFSTCQESGCLRSCGNFY